VHYGGERDESQVAGPEAPGTGDGCECQSTSLNFRPWACNRFRRICAKAGIEGLRLRDLRHEATSRLFESGKFSVMEVAAITGHKTLAMLKRYSHFQAEDLARRLG
jgi:integrase